MVATSRLRGAQTNMQNFRPFAAKFSEVLGSLAEKSGDEASPLLMARDEVKKINVVLCTSDRGLCGGFNVNLIDKAKSFIKENAGGDTQISFTNFGRRGRDWCRKEKYNITDEHIGVVGTTFSFNLSATAGRKLIDGFLNGDYDEVYVIFSEFISMGRQTPTVKQLLPIPPIETAEDATADGKKPLPIPPSETAGDAAAGSSEYQAEHICEPSPERLLGELLPQSVHVQLHSALLETSTSEHAARMAAMDNATKACNDFIENLTLLYNKARQAAITAELMDIVGGAEALRG